MTETWPKYSFIPFLLSLLFFFLAKPFLSHLFHVEILHYLFTFLLLTTLIPLSNCRKILTIGVLLALPSLFFNWLTHFIYSDTLTIAFYFSNLLFLLYIITIMSAHVFLTPKITSNIILGSICIYLLAGIFFALIYAFFDEFTPGAFKGIPLNTPDTYLTSNFESLLYYSFVTLTTLGYGDITTLTPLTRTFSYFEALFGQFYITTLVASLVAKHLHSKN